MGKEAELPQETQTSQRQRHLVAGTIWALCACKP